MQLNTQNLAEVVEWGRAHEGEGPGAEKRRYSRIGIVMRVEVFNHATGTMYSALTRNISVQGLGLIQSVAITRGQQLTVRLPREKQAPLMIQCSVMHSRELADGLWEVGMVFVSIVDAAHADEQETHRLAARILS